MDRFFNLARGRRIWNVDAAMKTAPLICLIAVSFLFLPDSYAQSARQLTRKIVPPSNNPPPTGAPPASRPAPAPPKAVSPASGTTNAVPAPPPPADLEKAKQETLKKTIEFEKKNADKGSAWAQYSLGLRYLTGDGVEKDEDVARKWLEAAAKNDDTRAKKKLEELNEKKKKK
jgi:TPR repeat protein